MFDKDLQDVHHELYESSQTTITNNHWHLITNVVRSQNCINIPCNLCRIVCNLYWRHNKDMPDVLFRQLYFTHTREWFLFKFFKYCPCSCFLALFDKLLNLMYGRSFNIYNIHIQLFKIYFQSFDCGLTWVLHLANKSTAGRIICEILLLPILFSDRWDMWT